MINMPSDFIKVKCSGHQSSDVCRREEVHWSKIGLGRFIGVAEKTCFHLPSWVRVWVRWCS